MYELEINGNVYKLNFGLGFYRKINKGKEKDGRKNMGLLTAVANLVDGDPDVLSEILLMANEGQDPRLTQKIVDAFIEDEDTDIDEVFEKVLGFLEKSNVTKKSVALIRAEQERLEKQKK